ncbi:MAG: AtpZ/AtpI family protein [Anaerolineales bacterium]
MTASPSRDPRLQYAFNLTLASVAGQVGCLTLVVIFIALFGGLWLDKWMGTRPLFTILALAGSVPVTIFLMFRVVRAATERIRPVLPEKDNLEDPSSSGGK